MNGIKVKKKKSEEKKPVSDELLSRQEDSLLKLLMRRNPEKAKQFGLELNIFVDSRKVLS